MTIAEAKAVHCPKCGAHFLIPDLPTDLRAKASALVREGRRFEATLKLKAYSGVSLVDAKAIVLHINPSKDVCSRCHSPIPQTEVSICDHCQALNLNW